MKFIITISQDEDAGHCLEVRAEKGMPLTVTARQSRSHRDITRGTLRSLIARAGLTISSWLRQDRL